MKAHSLPTLWTAEFTRPKSWLAWQSNGNRSPFWSYDEAICVGGQRLRLGSVGVMPHPSSQPSHPIHPLSSQLQGGAVERKNLAAQRAF